MSKARKIVDALDSDERGELLNAFQLSGPCADWYVRNPSVMSGDLCTCTGRLLPLGLVVRAIVIQESDHVR